MNVDVERGRDEYRHEDKHEYKISLVCPLYPRVPSHCIYIQSHSMNLICHTPTLHEPPYRK